MGKCKWIGLCTSVSSAVLCLVLAIVMPSQIDSTTKDQVKLTMYLDEPNYESWGIVPGHTNVNTWRQYYLYDVQNPEEVKWKGAKPVIVESKGYKYLETTDYIDRVYEDYEGEEDALVNFRRHLWYDIADDFDKTLAVNDTFTMVNLASFSAWDQMKRLPAPKVGLVALYTVVRGLDVDLVQSAYAQGLQAYINDYDITKALIYDPAGVDEDLSQYLWNDANFGWKNWTSLLYWVIAYQDCLVEDVFTYTPGKEGAVYMLKSYFGLDDSQMSKLLGGSFDLYYKVTGDVFKNYYECPDNGSRYCEPHYLAVLQWTQQAITADAPLNMSNIASIALLNSTGLGYPEISYFVENNYSHNATLRNVKWTAEDGLKLLDYNLTTGWPSGEPHTLLDLGHFYALFELGDAGMFEEIQALFDLSSVYHAVVLYDYINKLVEITAMQGRTDQSIYNQNNRGLTSELSMGNLVSQALPVLISGLTAALPVELTSRYAYVHMVVDQKLTCDVVLKDNGVSPDICSVLGNWEIYSQMEIWVLANWYGPGSKYWYGLLQFGKLTQEDLLKLYSESSTLYNNLTEVDQILKDHYKCSNPGPRCYDRELVELQWGQSGVTNNLPSDMSRFPMQNSTSVRDWGEPFASAFTTMPEYGAYAAKSKGAMIDVQLAHSLLDYLSFFSSVEVQQYFIYLFEKTPEKITDQFGITDISTMSGYLRFIVDEFALGGLFITETFEWYFFKGVSEFLLTLSQTNPLTGGDPALDPTQIQLGKNTTRAMLNIPDRFKHTMWTGKKDMDDKLRWFVRFYGSEYNNLLVKVYKGHDKNGPIINYEYVNPWKTPEKIKGGDGYNFQTNIDSDETVYVFLDDLNRFGQGEFDKVVYHYDMKCYRFRIQKSLVQNATYCPENDQYWAYGPNGVANVTNVNGGPVFASKPYFIDGDETLLKVINITNSRYGNYYDFDSYFDLEKYTGAVLKVAERLMTSVELKPDVLYPDLASEGLKEYGINTYLPVFYLNRSAQYSDSRVFLLMNDLRVSGIMQDLFQILGFTLFAIFSLVSIGILVYHFYEKKQRRRRENLDIVMQDLIRK